MNKKILKRYSLGIIGLMCLLTGCSLEQPIGNPTPPTGKPVEVRLQVNAPLGAAANNETDINRLRLVVFGSTGSPDAGRLIVNKYYPAIRAGDNLKEVITSGKRDIYLMVNEPLSGGGGELDSYQNIATVADVQRLLLAYAGTSSVGAYVPAEIPMCVERLNQQIRPEATNEIDGTVERTLAKVTLNLNIKNTHFTAGEQPVIDHITIKNLPESSCWVAQNYAGTLVTSEKQVAGVVAAASGYDFSSTNTFYVPEYLFNDPTKGAYIEIIGHVNGAPDMTVKYKVKLGDAMDDAQRYGDKYHITRNRHYTFTGDVKSYGEMDGVAVKVTVAPWNTVNMDEDTGRYVAFGKVTDNLGTQIAEGSNLADRGTTLNVECSTNTGGWYTVTRNAKGAIVHQSAATAAVSAVTSQTVSVTIPELEDVPYLQSYTVGIYHRTIAQEAVGPVRALNFAQGGGFIPNWVLIFDGWPADKLPPNGLQVAKRGNKVLPGGVTGDDPVKQWKTSLTSTPGTAEGLGMGVSSTAAMAGAEHPAAQYCRDMGAGWFLPSIDELFMISVNSFLLSASHAFDDDYEYWSASEYDSGNSMFMYFGIKAFQGDSNKGNGFRVRCVRAI